MSDSSSRKNAVPQNWLTRRGFVEAGARAGLFASLAASYATARGAAPRRFETTDPKLVHYREVRRFQCLRPDTRRLARGPDGRLWVAAGGYVCGFDEAGIAVVEHALPGAVRCLAVSPDGSQLLVGVSVEGQDAVHVLNPGFGTRLATWDSPGPKTWFTALAVTADTVYAADSGNRVILRYDRGGKLLGRIGAKDQARDIPGFVLPSPYLDVVVHSDGLLRVNNAGRHKVEAYTPDGELEASWGKPGMGIESFCGCCNPVSLATLPGGQIVTCEKGLPRVKVYSAQGEFEGVVAGVECFPENAGVATGETPGDGVRASLDAVADPQGRIYILDTVTGLVRVMARKGAV